MAPSLFGTRIRYNAVAPRDASFFDDVTDKHDWFDPLSIHGDFCCIHRYATVDCPGPAPMLPRGALEDDPFMDAYMWWGHLVGLFAGIPGGQTAINRHTAHVRGILYSLELAGGALRNVTQRINNPAANSVAIKRDIGVSVSALRVLFAFDAWQWGLCSCPSVVAETCAFPHQQPVAFVDKTRAKPSSSSFLGKDTIFMQIDSEDLAEVSVFQQKDELNCARDKIVAGTSIPVRAVHRDRVLELMRSPKVSSPSLYRVGHFTVLEVFKCISTSSSTKHTDQLSEITPAAPRPCLRHANDPSPSDNQRWARDPTCRVGQKDCSLLPRGPAQLLRSFSRTDHLQSCAASDARTSLTTTFPTRYSSGRLLPVRPTAV